MALSEIAFELALPPEFIDVSCSRRVRSMTPKVGLFHPGTQHSWQTALALQELGSLEFFATSIFRKPARWPYRLEGLPAPIGPKFRAEFARFSFEGLDPDKVETAGWHEWAERIAARAGFHKLASLFDYNGNQAFVRHLETRIRSEREFALWGFDSSSLTSFRLGKRHDRICVLDRTIGHKAAQNRILAELREDWPEWFSAATPPVSQQVIEAEDEEFALADHIVVGSEVAARTVIANAKVDGIAAKTSVLPYCYDERLFGRQPEPNPAPARGR